ncbi:MAG: hypothetical protein F4007_09510 [Chloroflexi bacterium]|nr:hypothetical protein [Chloroflexota bacterium]
MILVAMGEIVVVVLLRPLRLLSGGDRTPIGRGLHRFEGWVLRHLHVIHSESRMRQELSLHGGATASLASGLTEQSNLAGSTSDTIERMRNQTGATAEDHARASELQSSGRISTGRGRVDSSGGNRSDDIQQALLEAQRRQSQDAEQARRRRS